jgi:hypothetical protein
MAMAVNQAICFLFAVVWVSREQTDRGMGEEFLRILLATVMLGAIGTYFLAIIHWSHLTETVWGYLWRASVLFAGSNSIAFKVVGFFDVEHFSVHGVGLYLIAPWVITWLFLSYEGTMRSIRLTKHHGDYD